MLMTRGAMKIYEVKESSPDASTVFSHVLANTLETILLSLIFLQSCFLLQTPCYKYGYQVFYSVKVFSCLDSILYRACLVVKAFCFQTQNISQVIFNSSCIRRYNSRKLRILNLFKN